MSPKEKKIPVRIGLTKKPANADNSDMSASTMEALEDSCLGCWTSSCGSQCHCQCDPDNDLQDEIDWDADPEYVSEPSTSTKGKRLINRPHVQPKRSLNLLNKDKDDTNSPVKGKGRSNAPIWKYFIVSDRKVGGGPIEKGACCIVEVGGTTQCQYAGLC